MREPSAFHVKSARRVHFYIADSENVLLLVGGCRVLRRTGSVPVQHPIVTHAYISLVNLYFSKL